MSTTSPSRSEPQPPAPRAGGRIGRAARRLLARPATLVLHVGVHKTGTTALQHVLHDNAPLLARHGVWVAWSGKSCGTPANRGHHELVRSLEQDQQPNHAWRDLRLEIEQARRPLVVVSSEAFHTGAGSARDIARIREITEGLRLKVVCYLRRQDLYVESAFKQGVKAGRKLADVEAYAGRLEERLYYSRFLERWADAIGREHVVVRPYEAAQLRGALLEDFLRALGVAPPRRLELVAVRNPSVDAAGLALLALINRLVPKGALHNEVRLLVIGRTAAPPFAAHGLMTDSFRRAFLERFAEDNARTARIFLGRDALFLDPIDEEPAAGAAPPAAGHGDVVEAVAARLAEAGEASAAAKFLRQARKAGLAD